MTTPAFGSLGEAFLYCRDMDTSLSERLDACSSATRYLNPGYPEAVDRLVRRLKAYDAGKAAPKPGEPMPPFALPDEQGHLVTLDALLAAHLSGRRKTSVRGSPLCSVFQRNKGGGSPWFAPDPASLRQEAELGKRDEVDHLAGTHLIDLLRNLDQAIRLAQRGNQPRAITRELCDLQLSPIRPR